MPSSVASTADWLDRLARPSIRRLALGVLLVAAIVGVAVWIRRPGDFAGYLLVGNLVLGGRDIYLEAPRVNTWPPFFSLLCVPLALLAAPTPYLARGVWLLLNAGLLLVVLDLSARLVYGRRLSLGAADGHGLAPVAPALLVPLLLTGRFVVANFEHLQINLVLFALTLGGLYLVESGRPARGGVLLGFGAAIKVMPIAFVLYLAYRRRWRAALIGAATALLLSLTPVLVFGRARFGEYVLEWRAAVAAGWGAGRMNQSVFAMWDRFLGHGLLPLGARGADELPASGDPLVLVAVALTLAVVAGVAVYLFGARAAAGWPLLCEWSVVFIVAALFGPVSWKAYLVVLLLPNTLLFAVWRSPAIPARTRRVAAAALFGAFALGGLTAHGLVGAPLAERLEMTSAVTLATLLLLGGLLWLRPRLPAGSPQQGPPASALTRSA